MILPWQNNAWQQLLQARTQQRLPHALLVEGPKGTGKLQFTEQLANALLCQQNTPSGMACGECRSCKLIAAGTHPDFTHIKPLPPKKTTSSNPVFNIKVEVIRALCDKLNTTSQMQGSRVAVIEDADKMGHHAANSLLKTLEEPGTDTSILLHSSRPELLPITIRSRCQSVLLATPEEDAALVWLSQQKIDNAEHKLRQAHGAPMLASDEQKLDLAGRETLAQAMLAKASRKSSLVYASELAKLPKYLALTWCLDWVSDVIRIQQAAQPDNIVNIAAKNQLTAIASAADSRKLFDFYDTVCGAIRQEAIALNPQLLWENLLISWEDI